MKVKINMAKIGKDYSNKPEPHLQRLTNAPEKLGWDNMSDSDLPTVKYSAEEVEEEEANVEAEKGETILSPELFLHKIGGKSHKAGGTHIIATPGSFIYSNKVKVKGEEMQEIMPNLDEKKKYSMSDLSKKYIALNKFQAQLEDKNSDTYTRNTAELMVDNFSKKLGIIALAQEAKKGFPNGVPEVGQQTMAMGGAVKAAYGLYKPVKPYGKAKTRQGNITPTGQYNMYKKDAEYLQDWEQAIPGISNLDNTKAQEAIYDYTLQNNPASIANMWSQYGLTNKGRKDPNATAIANPDFTFNRENLSLDNLAKLKSSYADSFFGARQLNYAPSDPTRPLNPSIPTPLDLTPTPNVQPPGGQQLPPISTIAQNTPINPQGQQTYYQDNSTPQISRQDWMYTVAPAAITAASIPKLYPTRQQNYGLEQAQGIMSNVRPYDYQSQINEVNKSGYQAIQGNNAFARNSGQASIQNSAIAGRLAEATSNIRGKEYNDNSNLYNQNQQNIANVVGQIGADKEQQAGLYDDRITALNQNYYEDKIRARNSLFGALAKSEENSLTTYMMNRMYPNYKIDPWNLTTNFVAPRSNPITGNTTAGAGTNSGQAYINAMQDFKRIWKKDPTPSELNDYMKLSQRQLNDNLSQ